MFFEKKKKKSKSDLNFIVSDYNSNGATNEDCSKLTVLRVENFSILFTRYQKGLKLAKTEVISNLSISINSGEILAVVGSSGSGKSLLAQAILGILPSNVTVKGSISYNGVNLTHKLQKKLRGSQITLIPQSVNCLNPLIKIKNQVGSATKKDFINNYKNVFKRFGLNEKVGGLFPFQLSGGMARRVLVASAIVGGAKLIIADEPTPGLQSEFAEEILQYIRELANGGAAVMLITHDIGMAVKISDRVAVFYGGTVIEVAPSSYFEGRGEKLKHSYSKALWMALPQNDFSIATGVDPDVKNVT